MGKALPSCLLALLALAASRGAYANNPPNLTITGERYTNPSTYLFTGSVQDEAAGVTLVYRIKREEFRVPLRSRKTWRLRVKLRNARTRLVFFAIDREGRRSSRQKRLLIPQPPQDPQPAQ